MDDMTGRIVVGYDPSEHSRSAVRWAAAEAVRRATPLTVLHVVDDGGFAGRVPLGTAEYWPAMIREQAEKQTAEAADLAARTAPGVTVDVKVLFGSVPRALIEAS